MLTFILLFSLFSIGSCNIFYNLDYCNYDSMNSCLDNFICSWCNVSKTINNSEYYIQECRYNENICSSNFNKSSMCVYQKYYDFSCNFYETLMFCLVIFVLITSSYVIIFSLVKNFSLENRSRFCGFSLVILLLINIPAFILWTSYSHYFGYYILSLIFISFIACCTNSTKSYIQYRKTQEVGYDLINS